MQVPFRTGVKCSQFNAPSFTSGPIPARFLSGLAAPFSRPDLPLFEGKKSFAAASTGGRSGHFGTLLG
jgi:hypothetical protein